MPTHSAHLRFSTDGNGDVVDLTAGVAAVVEAAGSMTAGIAAVFVPGATAAITTMENEPGNVFDLPEAETVEQEVRNRRAMTKQIVAILTESDTLKGAERAAFVRDREDLTPGVLNAAFWLLKEVRASTVGSTTPSRTIDWMRSGNSSA